MNITGWPVTRAPVLTTERLGSDSGLAQHLLLLFARDGDSLIGAINFTGVMAGPFQAAYLGAE